MEFLRKELKLCLCCMTEHDVATVRVREKNIFMGEEIEYDAIYEYCAETDEYVASDEEISINNISMKNFFTVDCFFFKILKFQHYILHPLLLFVSSLP